MKELGDIYRMNMLKSLTFTKQVNKSIFEELPDFPIIFKGHHMSSLKTEVFDAICKDWNIPQSIINRSYNYFCLTFTNIRPKNIHFIEVRQDIKHVYCGNYIPEYKRRVIKNTKEALAEVTELYKQWKLTNDDQIKSSQDDYESKSSEDDDDNDDDNDDENKSSQDDDSSLEGEAEDDDL